ncbi:MAG: PAS domain S-box protein [candidate division NC10 bacterium]|nr:PAS domain S-box protein [candidate division NC10 bacterium]MBI4391736.1 PAS domain S-box protein [candidate division NC10 bacterium]
MSRVPLARGTGQAAAPLPAAGARLVPHAREVWTRLGPTLQVFAFLRVLVIAGSLLWVLLAPVPAAVRWPVSLVLLAFAAYSAALYALVLARGFTIAALNLWVFALDLGFATALVHLTGGLESNFYLAYYLLTALQAFYYGLRRGVAASALSFLLYVAVVRPGLGPEAWSALALRGAFLWFLGISLGLLSERERSRRREMLQLNRDLLEERERIKGIVETMQDGVLVLDRNRKVTHWNRALEERYGVKREEALGRDLLEAFPLLRHEGFAAFLEQVYAGQAGALTLERVPHRAPHRGDVILTVKGTAMRDLRAEVQGALITVEDVTERVGLEKAMQQAEKMAAIGTLSAGLAHEINNPIGIIASRVECMLLEGEEHRFSETVRGDLQVIAKHADRVARITQGLLSLSRQQAWRLSPVDLNGVVEEALVLMERQLARERVTLERDLVPGLPAVLGSANHLQQVILNLLTNAREAMPEGGRLRVATRRDGGSVEVEVTDAGRGIPAEHLSRIFDPFFTTKEAGTGLGLAISYGIVREHGGTLTVRSREGVGTTFLVTIPAAGPR